MTLDQLRHFHKAPRAVAAWIRAFGPVLCWLTPARRRVLLSCGALVIAIKYPVEHLARIEQKVGDVPNVAHGILVALLLFAFVLLCYLAAQNFSRLPAVVRRHPQVCLHAVLWTILALLWIARPSQPLFRAALVGCVVALPFILWRVGYMLFTAQRGKMRGTSLKDHLFYIFPIWGGSDTPYGKGFDYLTEAKPATKSRSRSPSSPA